MNTPYVSVIMSVYNGARYLREAVDSILEQTFNNFEFIVINDGSTDNTATILEQYDDPRIMLYHQENRGLISALNTGLLLARGEYVARMDADDRSHPTRLEKQVHYLQEHPCVGLIGTGVRIIDGLGRVLGIELPPADPAQLQGQLLLHNCFYHGSVMFRVECIKAVGGYRAEFVNNEDYDLWLRIAERYEMANLPEPLYDWRRHSHSVSMKAGQDVEVYDLMAVKQALQRRETTMAQNDQRLRRSLAQGYLVVACGEIRLGRLDQGEADLAKALTLNSELRQVEAFVAVVFDYLYRLIGRGWMDWDDAYGVVRGVFNCLPVTERELRRARRRVEARLAAEAAFVAHTQGRKLDVRRHALRCLAAHPVSFLANRGLVSISLEALFGAHAVQRLRAGRRFVPWRHDASG